MTLRPQQSRQQRHLDEQQQQQRRRLWCVQDCVQRVSTAALRCECGRAETPTVKATQATSTWRPFVRVLRRRTGREMMTPAWPDATRHFGAASLNFSLFPVPMAPTVW